MSHPAKAQIQFIVDSSFEGLLTGVFEAFAQKLDLTNLVPEREYQPGLFGAIQMVDTDLEKAERVSQKLKSLDAHAPRFFYKLFLSEELGRHNLIYYLIRLFLKQPNALRNYRDENVLRAKQIIKSVDREVHRMHAFVRFQRLADELWFAAVQPDYDVLPLLGAHFGERYADQRWLIYDVKRKYGLHFDTKELSFVQIEWADRVAAHQLHEDLLHEEEVDYRKLWQSYFESANIVERENQKLHLQHVPRRYWAFLTEKQSG